MGMRGVESLLVYAFPCKEGIAEVVVVTYAGVTVRSCNSTVAGRASFKWVLLPIGQ